MKRYIGKISLAVVMAATLGGSAHALAQAVPTGPPVGNPSPQQQPPRGQPIFAPRTETTTKTSARLQITLSKFDGDKRVSAQPYTMLVTIGQQAQVNVGAEVPVPTTSFGNQASGQSAFSYQMQRVGTSVSARVNDVSEGKYELSLNVDDRSVILPDTKPEAGQERLAGIPSFRSASIASVAILSNGESVRFMSALDPLSNRTYQIDVTLTIGNK